MKPKRKPDRSRWCTPWRFVVPLLMLAVAPHGSGSQAAEAGNGQRVLVDFEDTDSVEQTVIEAQAALVTVDGGRALEITTEAKASWPGVIFKPRDGKWDLAAFDGVKIDVRNPQDNPVRVLLNISNPGSDGQKRCNAESITVPADGKATLVVPFGVWHGEPNHPIDRSNIVSMMVMLDRAGSSHRFVVDNLRAVKYQRRDMTQVFPDPFFEKLEPALGRGVNLGNALEAPNEGEWGVTLEESYFEKIQSAGFDSVRIPVRWSNHAEWSAPYRIDAKFLARVDWAVRQSLEHKLRPLLNMHHYEEIMREFDDHRERFVALWSQIAEHYRDYPAALSFELLNEPQGNLSAEKWNRLLAETIAVVRRTNPTRNIVVGPVGYNAISKLSLLELPEDDRNLIATVHYYDPFRFTHQGASWVGGQSQAWLGTMWTGTQAERRAVTEDFDTAIEWAVKHRRPLLLGEFGAYGKADMQSRARWTRFVAEQARQRKMGTAYWEFCSSFGVYDSKRGQWIEPLKDALLAPPER